MPHLYTNRGLGHVLKINTYVSRTVTLFVLKRLCKLWWPTVCLSLSCLNRFQWHQHVSFLLIQSKLRLFRLHYFEISQSAVWVDTLYVTYGFCAHCNSAKTTKLFQVKLRALEVCISARYKVALKQTATHTKRKQVTGRKISTR